MRTAIYSRDLVRRNVQLSLRLRSSCLFSDNSDSRGFGPLLGGGVNEKFSKLAIARHDPLPLPQNFNFYPGSPVVYLITVRTHERFFFNFLYIFAITCDSHLNQR